MFSGLERKQAVQRRQQSVAWAWTKARNTMKDQTKATHAKLTSSVLLSSDCGPREEISNWRDSLAALNHRSLAKLICDQFYDLSILAAWRGRSAEIEAAERAFNKPGQLPVNATGAIGALSSELQIPWKLCRGLAVIGRTIGIVGHLAEELRNPIAREVWERTEEESSEHNRT